MKRALVCLLAIMVGITNLVAQSSGDYRSNTASGLWNQPASWQTYNGSNWVTASSSPTNASGIITIQSGHTITVSAAVSVDQVVINTGGTLVTNSGILLTLANGAGNEITVNGTLTNHGTIAFATIPPNRTVSVSGVVNNDGAMTGVSVLKLLFLSGSFYNHQFADGGVIPSATWDVTSTVSIVGYTSGNTTAPGGMNQQFGNFVWNAPGQDGTVFLNTGANGAPTTINGDFRVVSTGTDAVIYSTGGSGGTLNISKNLTVSGGIFAFTTGDTGPSAIDIAGNITISGEGFIQFADDQDVTIDCLGSFVLQDDAQVEFSASTGTTTFNLQGNYTQSGGSIFASGNVSNINFSGTNTQTYTSSLVPNGALNYTVVSGSTLAIPNNSFLSGSGSLNVQGILQVASTHTSGAIQTGTSNGNIRVSGTRTYASGATIVYNGTGAQFIGAGHPSAAGVITQINNASGVALAANIAINGTLELVSGNISIGARTLTLGGSIIPNANSIVTIATSNLIINGSGDLTLPLTGATLNNFTLNRGSGTLNTVYLSNHFTIAGTFTQSNGNLDFRGWILTISGNYNRTGGTLAVNEYTGVLINGAGTLGSIAFSSPAPATQPILNTLRLERPGSALTVSGNLYLTNDLLLVSGALTPGSMQMATGSKITRYDAGSITATPAAETSYNLIYQTSTDFATGPELPASATALANLTNQGTAVVTLDKNATVNGVLTLSNGTFHGSTRALTLRSNFVSNSIGNFVSGSVIFDGTTTISGTTPATLGAVTVNSGATLNLGPAAAPATTVNFAGNINNTGTINGGLSTAVFSGNTTLRNGTNAKLLGGFNNVSITGALILQTVTVAPNPDVDIEKITVSGNWVVNGGTFTANFSRVDFTGTSQTLVTNGSAFYSLYLEGTGVVLLHEPLTINNDLVIDNNVTLDVDINNNYTLTIKDDFTVNGTFQGRLGKVIFTNGESQSILRTATGTGLLTLFDLEVNKNSSATVDLQTNVAIQNSLVIKTATVFTAGTNLLTLTSTADRTAYVGQLPVGASVTGAIIVQRYLPNANGTRAWRYMTSPVTNSFVSDWKAEIPITGTFTDPSTGTGLTPKSPSMYWYDETNINGTSALGARYRAYPVSGLSSAAPLKSGLGYSVYIRGGTPLLDTRGTIGQGNVPVSITAHSAAGSSDGWNLIGNPYPSAIDWDNVTIPAGLNNAIYFTDNADNGGTGTGNVISYVAGVGTGSYSGLIAQGQAFWVHATANSTITFKEADKVAGQAQFFRQGEIPNVLRITMEGQGVADEAVLRLHEEATDGFDDQYDAYKWSNPVFNVATQTTDNTSLSINSMSTLDCNKSIRFTVQGAKAGDYVLNFTGITSFDDNVNIFLYDSIKNKTINVRETSQYTVTLTTDDLPKLAKRFSIILGKPEANLALTLAGEQVCATNQSAQVTLHNSEVGVSYALQRGAVVSEFIAGTGKDLQLPVQVSSLTEGENEITVLAKSSSCAIFPLNEKTQVTVLKTLVSSVEEGKSCHAGNVTLRAESLEASGFHWYEDLQSTMAIAGQEGAEFVTPVLSRTKTYYVAALNALGCEGERVAVKANVVIFDDVTLGVEGTTFTSSYATGNQWYLDGTLIEGATGATLTAETSGIYTVEVAINGCTSSASRELTITGEEGAAGTEFTLYPNPTADKIKLAIPTSKEVRVTLVSASGVAIANIELKNTGEQQQGEFDLTGYPNGVYILRIDDGDKLLTKKVTKIK